MDINSYLGYLKNIIDNNYDKVYDVVKVNAFESFAVSGVSEESGKIYKKSGAELSIDSEEDIYPGGEGAGYAGGITSAAADGIKIAEKIIGRYKPTEG